MVVVVSSSSSSSSSLSLSLLLFLLSSLLLSLFGSSVFGSMLSSAKRCSPSLHGEQTVIVTVTVVIGGIVLVIVTVTGSA